MFEIKYTFFTFQLAESGQWGIGMSTLGFLWFRSHRFNIEEKDERKCMEWSAFRKRKRFDAQIP